MNKNFTVNDKINLGYYPNYSLDISDINGDGKMEFITMDTAGNLLKVMNLNGELLFEKNLNNNGNWGTPLVCTADINCDHRDEIIVPDGESIIAYDGSGKKIKERNFGGLQKDDYGIAVPLLGAAKINSSGYKSIIACLAGGTIFALDADFNIIWKAEGLRKDFGHEIHFADVDGDGFDEIAVCTVDHINQSFGNGCNGDLLMLDHDGKVLLRRRVDDYIKDTHFDDIAMADFFGNGTCQILVEKGLLLDTRGNVIWDLSGKMEHGQWISHALNPGGKGRIIFISELWGGAKKSMLFTGSGQKIGDIGKLPWPANLNQELSFLPSRCHIFRWNRESEPEIFLTQQAYAIGNGHTCTKTRYFQLTGLFLDLNGNLINEIPINDAQIQGYYYNGEVHSRTADVDGDGQTEIVFPRQDGHIMIIHR